MVWRGGSGLGVGDGLCRASLGGGRKRCYIINPAGVGETVGETVQSHRQPTQQACYRSCGTKRRLRMGMGRRMDMGRAWGLMALGARASVGQGTYHLVQVMCRLVHAGPTSGFPQKRATTRLLGQKGRFGPASTPLLVLNVAGHSAPLHEASKPRLARCTTASQTHADLRLLEHH